MTIAGHTCNEFSTLMERGELSVREAAAALGISDSTVRRHLKGEVRHIDSKRVEELKKVVDARRARRGRGWFRFVDLFAGIGGLRVPFDKLGGQCVFTAERDRFSRKTYEANFPVSLDDEHKFAEDIRPWAKKPEENPKA